MDWILPDREAAMKKGWTHQVQWIDGGRPCFIRCKCGAAADAHATLLRKKGAMPIIIDLTDALQLHRPT